MIEYSNGTPLLCLVNKKDNGKIELMEFNEDDRCNCCIKIWDFHSANADLVNKIRLDGFCSMCLINKNKLFVPCYKQIKIFFLDVIDEEGKFKE